MVVVPLLAARPEPARTSPARIDAVLRIGPLIVLVLTTSAPLGAKLGVHGHPVRPEGLLGAGAPERRRRDGVAVELLLLRVRVREGVHPLVAQLRAVGGGDVTRGQRIHAQFPFMPAAIMMARLTAVRAIWTLYPF